MKEVSIYFEGNLITVLELENVSIFTFEDRTAIVKDKEEIVRIPSNYLIIIKDK